MNLVPRKLNDVKIPGEVEGLANVKFQEYSCLNTFMPQESQKYVDFEKHLLARSLPEFRFWQDAVALEPAVVLEGKVVSGF